MFLLKYLSISICLATCLQFIDLPSYISFYPPLPSTCELFRTAYPSFLFFIYLCFYWIICLYLSIYPSCSLSSVSVYLTAVPTYPPLFTTCNLLRTAYLFFFFLSICVSPILSIYTRLSTCLATYLQFLCLSNLCIYLFTSNLYLQTL